MIAAADRLDLKSAEFLSAEDGLKVRTLPFLFVRDFSESCVGEGEAAFAAARRALETWRMFDLEWVRVANCAAQISVGQVVAVEVRSLGMWTVNLSKVVETVDTATRFGFVYKTTALHVEEGEELFLLEFDRESGQVKYSLEAVSRPRSALARLGLPVTRGFQHKFARDSQRRMREFVGGAAI